MTIQERKKAIESFINKALPIYFMLAILAKYVVDEKYYGVYIFTVFGIWIEFFRMTSNLFGNQR